MAAWSAALLTFALLATVIIVVDRPLLLLGRFLPHGGWLEAGLLAVYAGWLTPKLLDPKVSGVFRRRAWSLFSVVFFAQFILGLAGLDSFVMTPGTSHLPIPALILAGPMYRGEGFFMLILFASSVALVGPAWCSHLCYIGAWDHALARRRKRPASLPLRREWARLAITVWVLGAALALRWAGVSLVVAGGWALVFGVLGVAVMVWFSRSTGAMVHCTVYCPVGLAATWLGRLSPFRLRITPACTSCGACTLACRYDALRTMDIAARRPAVSCTLCGDCLDSCNEGALHFAFWRLGPRVARTVFVVIVVALHAAALGLARV